MKARITYDKEADSVRIVFAEPAQGDITLEYTLPGTTGLPDVLIDTRDDDQLVSIEILEVSDKVDKSILDAIPEA